MSRPVGVRHGGLCEPSTAPRGPAIPRVVATAVAAGALIAMRIEVRASPAPDPFPTGWGAFGPAAATAPVTAPTGARLAPCAGSVRRHGTPAVHRIAAVGATP